MHPFRIFLTVLSSPTLHNVETRKTFLIDGSKVVCGVGEGLGMYELKIAPQMQKCPIPRLLSMIVDKGDLFSCFHHSHYRVIRQLRTALELKRKNKYLHAYKSCILFVWLFVCFVVLRQPGNDYAASTRFAEFRSRQSQISEKIW